MIKLHAHNSGPCNLLHYDIHHFLLEFHNNYIKKEILENIKLQLAKKKKTTLQYHRKLAIAIITLI